MFITFLTELEMQGKRKKCKFLGECRSIVLRETEGESSPGGKSACWQVLNLLRGVFDFFIFILKAISIYSFAIEISTIK